MTYEEFADVQEAVFQKRPPEEILHIAACRNVLLIVRPLTYKASGVKTSFKDDTDAVFCDIAVLDPVPGWVDNEGNPVAPHPAGRQFRDQMLLQGFLKGTFKNYLGKTCIGTIYTEPSGKGKPSIKFRSLAGNVECVTRARQFLAAHPEFLVPAAAQITDTTQQPDRYPATSAAPVSPAGGYDGYQQPDPWAQGGSQGVPAGQQHPNQGLSTLQQLRNAQGQPQGQEPPF